MTDARTKLDILYQDVLGDVQNILDQLDVLRERIPSSLDEALLKIQTQSQHLITSSEKLSQGLNDITKKVDAHINAAASSAGESVKLDIRTEITRCIKSHISETLMPILQKANIDSEETFKMLNDVFSKTENRMSSAANIAVTKLTDAIEEMKIQRGWTVLFCIAGAFIGSGLAVLLLKLLHLI